MALPQGTEHLIEIALAEDIGAGDVTCEAMVPAELDGEASFTQKAAGVIFGLEVAKAVFLQVDPNIEVQFGVEEGQWREFGPVLEARGNARSLLAAERTALNFLGRLSGVATHTYRFAEQIKHTKAVVLDTRKTTPGMRLLEKQAVLAGGGGNHRIGLYDQILIKENHAAMAGGTADAVKVAYQHRPDLPIEIEVRTMSELQAAVDTYAELGLTLTPGQKVTTDLSRIMLDNMDIDQMREAVELVAGRVPVEASGNVNLETIKGIAETGVDFISSGSLTHSAPVLDISMILEPTI